MPNYDFKCFQCEKRFGVFVSIKDRDQVKCPDCGGKTEQLFTGFLYKKVSGDGTPQSSSCNKGSCKTCGGC